MKNLLTSPAFGDDERYQSLSAGAYKISYTDSTHLEADDWRELADIELGVAATENESERSFKFQLALDKKFLATGEGKKKGENGNKAEFSNRRNIHVLTDTVSLCATRLGLLAPIVSGKTAEQLQELKKAKGIVLLPDTNSLYNGTLHWLMNVLRGSTLWVLPFVMSITQIQAREAALKAMSRNKKETNLSQALRSRAFVNAGLGFLERNHHRYQVLELDPSLLRYMKMPDRNGFDSDDSEVLEDRLLIEGVHSILRSTRTRAKQVVVTSDVLLSRVLNAEGIENLCLATPTLATEKVPNVRYDAWGQTYVGTTLRGFLWDLTHSFGSVRLCGEREHFRLACYWPGKLPHDWRDELLDVTWPKEQVAEKPASADENQETQTEEAKQAEAPIQAPMIVANDQVPTLSKAAVPQASLPLVMKLAGVLYAAGKGSLDELLEGLSDQGRPAKGNATRAYEVLRRANLIDFDGAVLLARKELDALDSNLRAGDLDEISKQFQNYDAYELILSALKEKGSLDRKDVNKILEAGLNAEAAQDASVRLVRYHTLLGQAWTDGDKWLDGSNRPEQDEYFEAANRAFDEVAVDNIAKVADFLPRFCRATRMSPWAAARAAQDYAKRLSTEYSLQYAAGGKPTGADKILTGSLLDLDEVVVPLDRIEIGGRPVLTLGRVKR
ncbi:hypothetical protein GGE07_000537 [Sinorhizobium terangae]|uniref:PIN domain-containing protein n=1 Tax=Sinorhizobium terangae TaxID=110322 RepID=A0A6N7LB16_SINTE|nr:hypothetical protein [Sinorhizobium terangae]MBB4183924.1 hypothetical protein [Sinorhizobium terangae]MQX15053.1 hypothetical protein [Sinorhizobium terangae]